MKKNYCLIIQNLITGEVFKIHDFSLMVDSSESDKNYLPGLLLFTYCRDLIKNQVPFNIDYQYEVSP